MNRPKSRLIHRLFNRLILIGPVNSTQNQGHNRPETDTHSGSASVVWGILTRARKVWGGLPHLTVRHLTISVTACWSASMWAARSAATLDVLRRHPPAHPMMPSGMWGLSPQTLGGKKCQFLLDSVFMM